MWRLPIIIHNLLNYHFGHWTIDFNRHWYLAFLICAMLSTIPAILPLKDKKVTDSCEHESQDIHGYTWLHLMSMLSLQCSSTNLLRLHLMLMIAIQWSSTDLLRLHLMLMIAIQWSSTNLLRLHLMLMLSLQCSSTNLLNYHTMIIN